MATHSSVLAWRIAGTAEPGELPSTGSNRVRHDWSDLAATILVKRCCCSVAKLCPTFCDPMDSSTPGYSVLHYLPEFAQIHVCWVGDAIQPSHPLPPSSPFAFYHFQHQGLFQWVSSSSGGQRIGASASASVLLINIQGWWTDLQFSPTF